MSDEERPRARALGGLALLEWLRPPPGFVTEAALGTTYSLDLVACAAALVSLDGTARDTTDFGLTAALRAIQRLARRVVVVAQQGCIHLPERTNDALLSMLDRFVRTAQRSLAEGAFHPKVWLVRQRRLRSRTEEPSQDDLRYVLIVGSRNLTRDVSWDLGVGLHGYVRTSRDANLPGLLDFVRFTCNVAGLAAFADLFPDVEDVEWEPPAGVREMHFGFHGAGPIGSWQKTRLHEMLTRVRRVLWISPFLDVAGVQAAATLSEGAAERRLVAGRADLDAIAQTSARKHLERLDLRALRSASEEPEGRSAANEAGAEEASSEDPELFDDARGLHAKVVAVRHDARTASVLIGSANLTARGWLGANVEAWLLLEGKPDLVDALWAWSQTTAAEYGLPARRDGAARAISALDHWHHWIAARTFTLREGGLTDSAELTADQPPLPSDARGVVLRVGRLARPGDLWEWPPSSRAMTLAGGRLAERSALLLFAIRVDSREGETEERSWLELVQLEPPLDVDARDSSLIREVVPPDRFLEYLRGLLDDELPDTLDSGEGSAGTRASGAGRGRPDPANHVGIEVLLRALARAPDPRAKIDELGRAIAAYLPAADTDDPRRQAQAIPAGDRGGGLPGVDGSCRLTPLPCGGRGRPRQDPGRPRRDPGARRARADASPPHFLRLLQPEHRAPEHRAAPGRVV